jgi:hypothetical protein
MGCPSCGTSTRTHWSDCPYSQGRPTPIRRRTDDEVKAYVEGYERALKMVESHGLDWAKESIQLIKEINNL